MANPNLPTVLDLFFNLHGRASTSIENLERLGSRTKGRLCQFPSSAVVVEHIEHNSNKTGDLLVSRYVSLKSEHGRTYRLLGVRKAIGNTEVPFDVEGLRSTGTKFSLELLNVQRERSRTEVQAYVEKQKDEEKPDDLLYAVGCSRFAPDTVASRTAISGEHFDRLKTVGELVVAKIDVVNSLARAIENGESTRPIIEDLGYQLQKAPNGRGKVAIPQL